MPASGKKGPEAGKSGCNVWSHRLCDLEKANCEEEITRRNLEVAHSDLRKAIREEEITYRDLEVARSDLRKAIREEEITCRDLETAHRDLRKANRDLEIADCGCRKDQLLEEK